MEPEGSLTRRITAAIFSLEPVEGVSLWPHLVRHLLAREGLGSADHVGEAVLGDGDPPRIFCIELVPVGARRTGARRTRALATPGPRTLAPGGRRHSAERRPREEREQD
eukprot:scaffold135215_cov60-Phaeocystis_antarctica.AAC.1